MVLSSSVFNREVYARPTDRVDDRSAALEILGAAPFVHLVSTGPSGFEATSLPMLMDESSGCMIGHVARGNPHWRTLDGRDALVIAVASDSYVSPSWYPSKQANGGKVVPTWNYEAVHVHGVARVRDDVEWLDALVRRLTDEHESRRTDPGERWAVSDAPADFVALQLKAIVGISVSVDRVEAKQKLSANRDEADRAGVVRGLSATDGAPSRMTRLMSEDLER